MSEFIVLGLIPGTHAQITFAIWLIAASLLAAAVILRASLKTKAFQAWVIATSLSIAVQRSQLRA
jgi:hypothetical protein